MPVRQRRSSFLASPRIIRNFKTGAAYENRKSSCDGSSEGSLDAGGNTITPLGHIKDRDQLSKLMPQKRNSNAIAEQADKMGKDFFN